MILRAAVPSEVAFAATMLTLLVSFVALLIEVCKSLEFPFGSDAMDLPVLSYALAAAEVSWRCLDGAQQAFT